ncbi:zf-HC2 domain-containing protein [Paenibacillus sp. 2TAB19]|uniref:zf-HC2 domain-containing protein n=1 Tax=Paenibacillus sp. 2TAB19 TaxID=3233003 RepID=UPI003F988AA2
MNKHIASREGADGTDDHVAEPTMRSYVEHRLSEQERELVDGHLAECEHCLQRFMDAAQATHAESELLLPDMDILEQRVIAQLHAESEAAAAVKAVQSSPRHARRRSWLQHPVAQYMIAASITLLLLGTGTFAGLSDKLSRLDQEAVIQPPQATEHLPSLPSESWSDRMVDRTGSWLDGIRESRYR